MATIKAGTNDIEMKSALKIIIHVALLVLSGVAICMLFGEPAEECSYGVGEFFYDKIAALALIWACCRVSMKISPEMWQERNNS